MQVDIPIIVTRSTAQHCPRTFKAAPPALCQAIKSQRAFSVPARKHIQPPTIPQSASQSKASQPQTIKAYHPLRTIECNLTRKLNQICNQTLEKSSKRSRRISSSAAARRFPKDFFKDENTHFPKTAKAKHKECQQVTFLDTFNKKQFATVEPTTQEEPETPTFKNKDSKWSSTPAENQRVGKGAKIPLKQRIGQDLIDTVSPFGSIPLISNFNLTIGQKDVMGQLIAKKQHIKARRREKENAQQSKGQVFRIRKKMPN